VAVSEAARLLKVSVVYVRREIRAGELPAVRLRRSVRIARPDLDAYVKARRGTVEPHFNG
jgi:excisionase family DNA binding protein